MDISFASFWSCFCQSLFRPTCIAMFDSCNVKQLPLIIFGQTLCGQSCLQTVSLSKTTPGNGVYDCSWHRLNCASSLGMKTLGSSSLFSSSNGCYIALFWTATIVASLVAQWVKRICLQCVRTGFNHWPERSWKSAWQPTPVFWRGNSHRQKRLVDYSPFSWKESDMTEWLNSAHNCKIVGALERGIRKGWTQAKVTLLTRFSTFFLNN